MWVAPVCYILCYLVLCILHLESSFEIFRHLATLSFFIGTDRDNFFDLPAFLAGLPRPFYWQSWPLTVILLLLTRRDHPLSWTLHWVPLVLYLLYSTIKMTI